MATSKNAAKLDRSDLLVAFDLRNTSEVLGKWSLICIAAIRTATIPQSIVCLVLEP